MGESKEDCTAVAPPHYFIHVDDFTSQRHLANHLLQLDKTFLFIMNTYIGSFLDTAVRCRMCALLQVEKRQRMHKRILEGRVEMHH